MKGRPQSDAVRKGKGSRPTVESLLADPAASLPLKDVLLRWLVRDPVDAARDAALLTAVLAARADNLLAEAARAYGCGVR